MYVEVLSNQQVVSRSNIKLDQSLTPLSHQNSNCKIATRLDDGVFITHKEKAEAIAGPRSVLLSAMPPYASTLQTVVLAERAVVGSTLALY